MCEVLSSRILCKDIKALQCSDWLQTWHCQLRMRAADDGNRQYSAIGAIYRLYAVMGEVVMECCVYVCLHKEQTIPWAGSGMLE